MLALYSQVSPHIYLAQIIISNRNGLVPLHHGEDTQCYNYTLPYRFARVPQVAIAVYELEAQKTDDLFFAIKPLPSKSLTHLPFVIRTQWKYTNWTKISYTFLA